MPTFQPHGSTINAGGGRRKVRRLKWNTDLKISPDFIKKLSPSPKKLPANLIGKGDPMARSCSFCSKSTDQVHKIITGPSTHICNECVSICRDLLNGTAPAGWEYTTNDRCNFCGRTPAQVDRVIAKQNSEARICNNCYKLCVAVLEEGEGDSQ